MHRVSDAFAVIESRDERIVASYFGVKLSSLLCLLSDRHSVAVRKVVTLCASVTGKPTSSAHFGFSTLRILLFKG